MDRWGFFFGWVGVAGLILVVPLNILSSFMIPKVQNWWATTSSARRKRRYGILTSRFKTMSEPLGLETRFECIALGLVELVKGFLSAVIIAFLVLSFRVQTIYWILPHNFLGTDFILPWSVDITVRFIAYIFTLWAPTKVFTYFTASYMWFAEASVVLRNKSARKLEAQLKALGVDKSDVALIAKPENPI